MSVKCEKPLNELTVQVCYSIFIQTLIIGTLFVSRTELRTYKHTDRHTNGRTDDPITRCPRRTFQAGGIKIHPVIFEIHFVIFKIHFVIF